MYNYIWHTYITSYEGLEQALNSVPANEDVFCINTVGAQAVIITRGVGEAAVTAHERRRRLLESMNNKALSGGTTGEVAYATQP